MRFKKVTSTLSVIASLVGIILGGVITSIIGWKAAMIVTMSVNLIDMSIDMKIYKELKSDFDKFFSKEQISKDIEYYI